MKHLVYVTQLMGINEVEIILLDSHSRVSSTALCTDVVFLLVIGSHTRKNYFKRAR